MEILAIMAQDIKFISLAWWREGEIIDNQDFSVEPDDHLSVLQDFLDKNKKNLKDIDGILVITGPGSFTASRVSVTLVNILAWAKDLSIITLENPNKKTLLELLSENNLKTLNWQKTPVLPVYNRSPNITIKKKK